MTVAWTMVDTLQRAGQEPDASRPAPAARSLDTTANPFLLPGTRLRTSAKDAFPIDAVYLYRYDNQQWVRTPGLSPRDERLGATRSPERVSDTKHHHRGGKDT